VRLDEHNSECWGYGIYPAPHRLPPQRLLAHPATIALAAAGSTTTELADALGITRSMASRYLAGTTRQPEHMPAALRALVGDEAATEVLALIPTTAEASASS
jgi:hypothetical protein